MRSPPTLPPPKHLKRALASYKNAWTHNGKVMTIDNGGKIVRVVSKKKIALVLEKATHNINLKNVLKMLDLFMTTFM